MSVARNTRKPETVKADLAERRAAAEKRAKAQIAVLHAETLLRRCRDTADALERLQMRMPLTFATLADLAAAQPWAIREGVVLGHLLTMEDGPYRAAMEADAFDAATLGQALRMAWAEPDEYQAWATVYIDVLRKLADEAEAEARSAREQGALYVSTVPANGGTRGRGGL